MSVKIVGIDGIRSGHEYCLRQVLERASFTASELIDTRLALARVSSEDVLQEQQILARRGWKIELPIQLRFLQANLQSCMVQKKPMIQIFGWQSKEYDSSLALAQHCMEVWGGTSEVFCVDKQVDFFRMSKRTNGLALCCVAKEKQEDFFTMMQDEAIVHTWQWEVCNGFVIRFANVGDTLCVCIPTNTLFQVFFVLLLFIREWVFASLGRIRDWKILKGECVAHSPFVLRGEEVWVPGYASLTNKGWRVAPCLYTADFSGVNCLIKIPPLSQLRIMHPCQFVLFADLW